MTTITIELTDEQAQAVAQEAQRLKLPASELALRRLLAPWQPVEQTEAPDYETLARQIIAEDHELLKRLA